MVKVALLYFEGCPSWRTAWGEFGDVLAELGIDATVSLRNIDHLDHEARRGFAGAPTICINGRDLEDYDDPPLMACRRYMENNGRGWPSKTLLRQRLEDARG